MTQADDRDPRGIAPLIEFQNVSRRFGMQEVLRDVSFGIRRGESVAIIGESGCGKSVTLKLMIALLAPTAGAVLLDGRPHTARTEKELTRERLRFGYVFQQAALFDSMSVEDNVAFGLRQNTDLAESEIGAIVRERLNEVGLPASVCRKKPAELSGGMKKRVGLARALALSPEIVLYDEPTTGLDPIMSDVINELIVQARERRPITAIVVTHDMVTVGRTVDRVIMLYPLPRLAENEPQIVFDGTPAEVFSASDQRVYQFVHGQAGERLQELALR